MAHLHDCMVIGGGQAGLAAAFELDRIGADFVIIDLEQHTGDQWRRRWRSLRLFTPARYDSLPGTRFPAAPRSFPTTQDVAEYLEGYAVSHGFPIQHGQRVLVLSRTAGGFVARTAEREFHARTVVIATGATSTPRIPSIAAGLDRSIAQLHSADYRDPGSLPGSRVLVVGYGTSGAELAIELADSGRETSIAGTPTATVPDAVFRYAGALYWLLISRILTRSTPAGRRLAQAVAGRGAPLIRVSQLEVRAAGVREVPRIDATAGGRPFTAGVPLDVDAVLWCTGYRADFSWIDVPAVSFDADGFPVAPGGFVDGIRDLAFLGLPFQTRLASHLLGGVRFDARRVVRDLRPMMRGIPAAEA